MKKAVIAIAPTPQIAEAVITQLYQSGFGAADVSVLYSKDHHPDLKLEKIVGESTIAGAATGSAVGGAVGLIVGLGVLLIPGIGPLIAIGPLLGVLGGVAAGSSVGGMVGAVVGLGVNEIEAQSYVARIREGHVLIAVHTEDHTARMNAHDVFRRVGLKDTTQNEVASADITQPHS